MTPSFLERVAGRPPLLGDGAMGTELQKRGLSPGECPEEFNILRPEVVQGIYRDYFEAGSDIVETNTFGANRSRLTLHGLADRAAEISERSARLARQVCPGGRFVAGSIGPTGDILEPLGSRSLQEARDIFREQAKALADGGVDVIIVETMMAVEEAEIAVRAVREATSLPVVATMTFEMGKAGLRTPWGVTVDTAVERLTGAGAHVIGSNCGNGFDDMIAAIKEMARITPLPLVAQPNAGVPQWKDGTSVYKETPDAVRPKAQELLDLGVAILGGCCGTNPGHIRMMRQLIDNLPA